jgi:hypothetical protein
VADDDREAREGSGGREGRSGREGREGRDDHDGRQPGWREVIALAGLVVAFVLGAAILTSVLPTSFQEVVFHTPLAIVVLIVGTGWLLWRISRRTGSAQR